MQNAEIIGRCKICNCQSSTGPVFRPVADSFLTFRCTNCGIFSRVSLSNIRRNSYIGAGLDALDRLLHWLNPPFNSHNEDPLPEDDC
jgi:hypothetical protein